LFIEGTNPRIFCANVTMNDVIVSTNRLIAACSNALPPFPGSTAHSFRKKLSCHVPLYQSRSSI